MSGGIPRAQSIYRGLRATITQLPGAEAALVTVGVKGERDRWDEWSLLFPAIRVELGVAQNSYEAVEMLRQALSMVGRALE